VSLGVVVLAGAAVAAVALAQSDQGGGQTSAPQAPSATADVPEGPYVDFCPTPEQTEAHLAEYGFDYKPTVGCNREGKVESAGTGSNGDDANSVSDEQRCQHTKQLLESAKPVPDSDGDPTTMAGELPDGKEVAVDVMTDKPELYQGQTVNDQAKDYKC
jgi:hypothetical protein